MSCITSTSGYAGYQWQWFQPASTSTTGSTTPAVDSDGDGDNSPMVSALTPSSNAASGSTANASPLALLSNDLQSLLTSLQDVSASGASPGLGSGGTASPGGGPIAQFFASADTNGDGSIDQSEWEAAAPQGVSTAQADQSFAKIDTNGDGSISPSELKNTLGHGGGHHGHHHAEAASGSSTSDLSNDVNSLLQTLQQMGSTTSTSDTSTAAAGGTPAVSGNTALNDQFSKMLADLSSYLQSEGTSTVQVSA
jgi:EF hand